jgi:hypothetical protein
MIPRQRRAEAAHTVRVPKPGDWLVIRRAPVPDEEDDGVLRIEPSRHDAVAWACIHAAGAVLARTSPEWRVYEYRIGLPGESHETYIVRAYNPHPDVVAREGLDQQPLYPYIADPHQRIPRPEKTKETA